jgi:putative membrane protein
MSEHENDMAERRTRWAEDRTVLANERTFASWMGTGMAAIGVALGLKAVFSAFEPTWVPRLVSTIFITVSILIFWAARRNSVKMMRRLNAHSAEPQTTARMTLIASILSVGAAATGLVLWFL